MKLKPRPIVKRHGPDTYTFIAGVAQVPGTNMKVTLKEFNKASQVAKRYERIRVTIHRHKEKDERINQ